MSNKEKFFGRCVRVIGITVFLFLAPLYIRAQYPSEGPSSLTAGTNVRFYPYTFNGDTFLVMEFTDHSNCSLTGNPIVKFKMSDGSELKFEGIVSNSETNSSAYKFGYVIINSSTTSHCVAMPITKEEIECLKVGVDKISINTLPVVYKRSKWAGKKSFGETLYDIFQKLKGDFEE